MCVIDEHVFKAYALLDNDMAQVKLKTLDRRSMTMDLQEWKFFLESLGIFPSRLTKEEAWQIFQGANVEGANVEGANWAGEGGDDDATELNFLEFIRALKLLASLLKIDWQAIEAARRFGHVLLTPRLFARYAAGVGGQAAVSQAGSGGGAVEKSDTCAVKMYLAGWLMLLESQQLVPQFVRKDDAVSVFRNSVQASDDPHALMDEHCFRLALSQLARLAGAHLQLPSVTIDSQYARVILGHRCRSLLQGTHDTFSIICALVCVLGPLSPSTM